MVKQPKFSIIVPVYNVEKYLSFCMESLINQTLRDIEIICVNDGSADASLLILEEYRKLDDRIIIVDKKNGGLSSARNAGLDLAEGEFILFVDSDDYLEENTCDRLYVEMLQEDADIVVFGTNLFPWYVKNNHIAWLWSNLEVETKKYEGNTIHALFWERSSKPFVWNECYKRSVIEEHHLRFDEDLLYGEDMLFLFTIFPRVKKVVYIQDKLYNYRCDREGSLMSKAGRNAEWKLDMHMSILEKILRDWDESDYLKKAMDDLYFWCLNFTVYDIENIDLTDDDKKKKAVKLVHMFHDYNLHFHNARKDFYSVEKKLEKLSGIKIGK